MHDLMIVSAATDKHWTRAASCWSQATFDVTGPHGGGNLRPATRSCFTISRVVSNDDLIWHYTDAEGLRSIVTSGVLRATSAAFMNDAEELKSGRAAIREYWDEIAPDLSEKTRNRVRLSGILGDAATFSYHLISASSDGDSLTLWRNYGGNEVAYAIGLERSRRLVPVEKVPGSSHPDPPAGYYDPEWEDIGEDWPINVNSDPDHANVFGGDWRGVKYVSGSADPKVRRYLDRAVQDLEKAENRIIRFNLLPGAKLNYMKHAGFEDEREVRALFWVHPTWKFIHHRASRFGLIPYVEVTTQLADEEWAAEPAKLPIRAVTIGPNAIRGDAEQSLRIFLEHHGYGNAEIRQSITPYR